MPDSRGSCVERVLKALLANNESLHFLKQTVPKVISHFDMESLDYWAEAATAYTPEFWKYLYSEYLAECPRISTRLGNDIIEEVVACLLGGFGFKAEVGISAFREMKQQHLIRRHCSFEEVLRVLIKPLYVNGKYVHYRFPGQKARYISDFLNRDDLDTIPLNDDLELRRWLLSVNGIGLKTASWITRNYLNSDKVAVIDIHIYRAGILAGFIEKGSNIQRDYLKIEKSFLDFCESIDVRPAYMDEIMWWQMKDSNRLALKLINHI